MNRKAPFPEILRDLRKNKVFDYIDYKGPTHKPAGHFLEIYKGLYRSFIRLNDQLINIKLYNGSTRLTRIELISISQTIIKGKETEYNLICWRDFAPRAVANKIFDKTEDIKGKPLSKKDKTSELESFARSIIKAF